MDQSTKEEITLLAIKEKNDQNFKENYSTNLYLASLEADNMKDDFFFHKTMILILLFFILCSISFFPLTMIKYFKFQIQFKFYGYIILIILFSLLFLSLLTYLLRNYLTKEDSPAIIIYIFFIIYTVLIIGFISIFGLYENDVAFAINVEITTSLLLLFTLNKYFCFYKKFWINLIIVYILMFFGIIFYISYFNRMFIEFFVITIYCSISFGYLTSLSKFFYEEMYYNRIDSFDDPMSLRIHMTIIISSHIDIIMSTFRE